MWSLRLLTVLVGLAVIVSFALASYSVKATLNDRDKRIAENFELARLGILRGARACESQKLIVVELSRLAENPALIEQVNALNARYPEIQPCVIPKDRR